MTEVVIPAFPDGRRGNAAAETKRYYDASTEPDGEAARGEAEARGSTEEARRLLDDAHATGDEYPPLSRRRAEETKPTSSPPFKDGTSGLVKGLLRESLPSLLLALVGGIMTGSLLEAMQGWTVFIRVEELFILVPIVMNLKGNLEMNLAARLSTSANVGDLDVSSTRRALILGNLFLLQVQALLVSFLASLLSFVLGMLSRNNLPSISRIPSRPGAIPKPGGTGWKPGLRGGYYECAMVLCAGMLAASLSSALLGSFMCVLVVMCRKVDVNPDNVATPIAASLGDLLTLLILGSIGSVLIRYMSTAVSSLLFVLLVLSAGLHIHLTFRNRYVRCLLKTGWPPLVIAVAISSGTGLVLERFVNALEGFGLIAPVVTMVAGNTGAIFVSRIATALHSDRPEPRKAVGGLLFGTGVFVLCSFLVFIRIMGQTPLGGWLAFSILSCSSLNIAVALGLAHHLCEQLWKRDYDPDMYALPLLSSMCDVTGQLLLVLAYTFANAMSADAYATTAMP